MLKRIKRRYYKNVEIIKCINKKAEIMKKIR